MTNKQDQEHRGFSLRVSEDDPEVAYLRLPGHPGDTVRVSKSVRLFDVLGQYVGPDVVLDFDANGVLVGIEVVG